MNGPERDGPSPKGARGWTHAALLFALGGVAGSVAATSLSRWPSPDSVSQGVAQGSRADAQPVGSDGSPSSPPGWEASAAASASPPRGLGPLGQQPLGFVVIGGGADPASTQVQLEQDVALFTETFGASSDALGATLFAGGPGVRSVQVLDDARSVAPHDPSVLRDALGELLDPRAERGASFRGPHVPVHGSADADLALSLLSSQLELPGPRLEVFVASHGDLGDSPAENYVALWGDSSFDARQLAAALSPRAAQRGARVVVTACFGGGFAELAFQGGDVAAGPTHADVCGLFATSADHESSGCDANPDRRSQEGYALHLLHALRGQDREGARVAGLDLDGDGRVGLLEAHTRARIASHSIDLPSTTSERYLRALQSTVSTGPASLESYATPEEDAVIRALGAALGLTSEEEVAAARLALEAQLDEHAATVEQRALEEEEALRVVVLTLASRWPELLDPFRPDFEATLRTHARELAALLRSPQARAHTRARQRTDQALQVEDSMRIRWVRLHRLERAFETRRLARAIGLRARDDPERLHYEALLACERAPLGEP